MSVIWRQIKSSTLTVSQHTVLLVDDYRKLNKQNFIRPVINFRASTKYKNTKPLEPNFPLTFTLKREISQMVDLHSFLVWTRLLLKGESVPQAVIQLNPNGINLAEAGGKTVSDPSPLRIKVSVPFTWVASKKSSLDLAFQVELLKCRTTSLELF